MQCKWGFIKRLTFSASLVCAGWTSILNLLSEMCSTLRLPKNFSVFMNCLISIIKKNNQQPEQHERWKNKKVRHTRKTVSNNEMQCCQLVYIYTKFEKCVIFSQCLVYNFLIWYIGKIWYIFVRRFSWDFKPVYLVYNKAKTEKPTKVQRFCLTWEKAWTLGKRRARLEESWDVLKKTELSSRYALLGRQCIQMWESCVREWQKILQRAADRAGVACKEVFNWCCVSLLLTVQKDNWQLLGQ